MARKLVQRDVLAEQVPHSGAWVLSATTDDGAHHRKTYYGYSKRDALSRFVEEVNAGDDDLDRIRTRMKVNAPLRGAQQIGSNMTEVEHGDLTILYSYKTPVAFLAPQGGYITEHRWSVTTSKHIAKFFDRHGYDRKGAHKLPQEDLEAMVSAGEVAGAKRLGHAPLERRGNPAQRGIRQRPSPDDPYPDPGKFEGETMLAVEMFESAMEGGADEEGGDVDGPGYFWLFTDFIASDGTPRHGILLENSQGFVTLDEYETATDAHEAWEAEVEPELDEWNEEGED